jgi:MSHA pilin protein MshA
MRGNQPVWEQAMRIKQQGFTLVELVVVIVILGILAAIAIPRYASYTRDARIASLNGLAGAVRSSVMMVQGRYVASGSTGATVTLADGSTVDVSSGAGGGIPLSTAGGIDAAVSIGGFTYAAGAATGTFSLATAIAGCDVTYTAATGGAQVNLGTC